MTTSPRIFETNHGWSEIAEILYGLRARGSKKSRPQRPPPMLKRTASLLLV
ncbi:hypothetical protein L798_02213 [Zootermopsis nevadensis]|uniref:Uncharacterized protein n=1 Tax=Zootermopsis nevadensis TaxID=136037 RepID=A0A067QHJ8_ZOONE|nr:hypothetical protein L798_02213 [Zootermopsis nevadensis]